MQHLVQRSILLLTLVISAVSGQAQTKTSTLHTLTGRIVFPDVRVYLFRGDLPSDYPFVIYDLSVDYGQGDYMMEDSVFLQSTGVHKILCNGFSYQNPEASIRNVTVVKHYKVIVRDSILPPLEHTYPNRTMVDAQIDSTGQIRFPASKGVKPSKKEIKSILESLIANGDTTSFLDGKTVKQLYKQRRGKTSSGVNWNFELDRVFIQVNYDPEESDQAPLILEIEQISKP